MGAGLACKEAVVKELLLSMNWQQNVIVRVGEDQGIVEHSDNLIIATDILFVINWYSVVKGIQDFIF